MRRFVVSNVGAHAKGPLDVQIVLVQLQQEDNQHEQGVDHEEGKHGIVAQFLQVGGNSILKGDLWERWVKGEISRDAF